MNNNDTAVDKEKAVNGKTMQAMNEQYKNCKTERREYQIGKGRCVIVRHYCGDKDLSEVLYRNAFERAFSEVMTIISTPKSTRKNF
mgnify:CR=1 FL=1